MYWGLFCFLAAIQSGAQSIWWLSLLPHEETEAGTEAPPSDLGSFGL